MAAVPYRKDDQLTAPLCRGRGLSHPAMSPRHYTSHSCSMSAPTFKPQTRSITIEEFAQLPEEASHRLELVRGWVVRELPPDYAHGRVTARLVMRLGVFAKEHQHGEVLTACGVVVSEKERTVRVPDVAFVAAAH